MFCLRDVVSVASDGNHRCAARNDDSVNYWSFTVNYFPVIRDLTITLLIYLKGGPKKQDAVE